MKNKGTWSKILAMLLVMTLVLGVVTTGVNEIVSDPEDAVYSDWLRPDDLLPASAGLRSTQEESYNLSNFLDRIAIEGLELNNGKYTIIEGVPYTIQMFFSEKTNSWQFPTNTPLVYHFPNGFAPLPTSGRATMTGDGGNVYFDYVISEDTLTVTFDQTSPGWNAFIASENARFEVHTTGEISQETIEFSSEVSGTFEIDTSRTVTVRKTGSYDAKLNQIRYTVQAYSKGTNTDVHIGDIISGTALTYDPNSITVTSDKKTSVSYNADTRAGETFGLTIPSMENEETITIEYVANVNLGSLDPTGNGRYGTVEQTGNSVRVSIENKPGYEVKIYEGDFQHQITLSTNSKTASFPTVRDGKSYVTWTIVLNEDANISLAGKSVTDTISALSQGYMRYSGSGIHIEKFEKNSSTAISSDDIQWGTAGLSSSHGGSSWTYTIPASDAEHNYRYVITYETEVDSDTFLVPTTVSNTVETEYDRDHGAAYVGTTGDSVEAEKKAGQSTVNTANKTAETEWEITFTVPQDGLDSAVVIDSLPGFLDPATMTWYYDTYKENSVRVKEGDLQPGEGFSVDASSQDHKVVITFTKNNGESYGLTGTGLTRTIHVFLTTTAGSDWLTYAETESRARTHTNNAIVRVNGQDLNVTASVNYNTTGYEMEKDQTGTYATTDTPALPIYVYRIILTGVDDAAFDDNGLLTITDTYDSDYLVFKSEYLINSTDAGYVNEPNGFVYGNNQWNIGGMTNKGPYVVDQADSQGHLVFKLNRESIPKQSDGSYWPYYTIYYALQIKDAETLAWMQEEALHTYGLKVPLENIAYSYNFGTTTITTDYTVNALEKTLKEEIDNSTTGTHDLKFEIKVNPQKLKIGDGEMITVKDTLSNLSFDYTSITVTPTKEGDTLNRVGNSIIFTLHNEQDYTITYTTRLIGLQNVHWNNRAELYGYTSGESGTSSVASGGSGQYTIFSMNVKKYADGNMNKGLAAKFKLSEARVKDENGKDIQNPVWKEVGEFTTNASTGFFTIEKVKSSDESELRSLRPYSYHNAEGQEQFGSGQSYGWRYKLVETVAPDGYQLITEEYIFGISDIPSYTAPYKYLNGDTVTVVNKPVSQYVQTSISGTKILVGKNLEAQEFTFTLVPEETAREGWDDAPYPGGFRASECMTVQNDENGSFSFALSYTYADYTAAQTNSLVDANGRVTFLYVVKEALPEQAVDRLWNNVLYDASEFLVSVQLFLVGGQLQTEVGISQYTPTESAANISP